MLLTTADIINLLFLAWHPEPLVLPSDPRAEAKVLSDDQPDNVFFLQLRFVLKCHPLVEQNCMISFVEFKILCYVVLNHETEIKNFPENQCLPPLVC